MGTSSIEEFWPSLTFYLHTYTAAACAGHWCDALAKSVQHQVNQVIQDTIHWQSFTFAADIINQTFQLTYQSLIL